jgi:Rrf2 family protein
MLSLKAQYGLRAMVSLAAKYGKGPLQAKEIAATQSVPVRYLELLLSQLRRSRLVEATRGKNGGYVLTRNPNAITVWDVVTAFEGKAVFAQLKESREFNGKPSPLSFVWKEAEKRVVDYLTSMKISEVLNMVQSGKENYHI